MDNNLIQKAQSSKQMKQQSKTMQDYIKSMQTEIKKALPSVITPERFTRMTLSALSVNPKLQMCSPKSFLGAMMTAAQLGVEPNTALGQAYLIPYKNECQFQLGYKGLIDLAYRSGEVSIIQAHEVRENDDFTYELGLDPKLKHIPAKENRGNTIAYYAMFKTKSGGYGFEVMSIDDVRSFAIKNSKSYMNGPWQTNFDEMAKKTVLKRVLKYAPMKSDFVRAVAQDETIKTELSEDMFSVPNENIIDTDYTDIPVDESTGEEKEADEEINAE